VSMNIQYTSYYKFYSKYKDAIAILTINFTQNLALTYKDAIALN